MFFHFRSGAQHPEQVVAQGGKTGVGELGSEPRADAQPRQQLFEQRLGSLVGLDDSLLLVDDDDAVPGTFEYRVQKYSVALPFLLSLLAADLEVSLLQGQPDGTQQGLFFDRFDDIGEGSES